MFILACAEQIAVDLSCPTGWVASAHAAPFDIALLSPEVAIQYFGAGFALPVVPLATAFAVAFLVKFIKG